MKLIRVNIHLASHCTLCAHAVAEMFPLVPAFFQSFEFLPTTCVVVGENFSILIISVLLYVLALSSVNTLPELFLQLIQRYIW